MLINNCQLSLNGHLYLAENSMLTTRKILVLFAISTLSFHRMKSRNSPRYPDNVPCYPSTSVSLWTAALRNYV